MGTFLNTNKKITVDSLVKGVQHRLDNPFYIFNDKHPTSVTFYNINDTKSSLDEASRQIYDVEGPESPLRYNKIKDVFLYGLERIQAELDVGDFGTEAGQIQGECYLPPNSFKPYPESYFKIDYITRSTCWFRVTKVTMDTLENGNNFWKLEYVLDQIGEEFTIDKQVDKNFTMFIDNVGSNYKSVIQDEEVNFIERIEDVIDTLKSYYNTLFFQPQLQTYVYKYEYAEFYDPEVIEFIIRNKLLIDSGNNYTFINQATSLPDTFVIQYDKSLYRNVETGDKNVTYHRYYGIENEDPLSLLSTRLQDYYIVYPYNNLGILATPIDIYPNELVEVIKDNKQLEGEKEYLNIIGNYFNDKKKLSDKMLDGLESINYTNDSELYHMIPIIIFILIKEITTLLEQPKVLKDLY